MAKIQSQPLQPPQGFEKYFEQIAGSHISWWMMAAAHLQAAIVIDRAVRRANEATKRASERRHAQGITGWKPTRRDNMRLARSHMRLTASYLGALSIELWLKGFVVYCDPTIARNEKKWKQLMTYGHKLSDVNENLAHLKLSQADRSLLVKLTTCLEWAGRYPVATSEEKFRFGRHPTGAVTLPMHEAWMELERTTSLLGRMQKALKKLRPELFGGTPSRARAAPTLPTRRPQTTDQS